MPKVIENWLQGASCPVSFHRNNFAIKKKKKEKYRALKLKDHQHSVLMTAGHSELGKRILKDWN